MLKSLAIGLLTLTAACSTAAFAHDGGSSWNWNPGGGSSCCWFLPWTCWDHHHHHHHPGGGVNAAPEIDPAGAMAALSLLAGGLAVMRGRRSGRK